MCRAPVASRIDLSRCDMVVVKTLRAAECASADGGGRTASEGRRPMGHAACCEVGEGEHHE
jgi:hypothetical protein